MTVSGCYKYHDEAQNRRQTYIISNSSLDQHIRAKIAQGKIGFGMTTEDVNASWGLPYDINRSAGPWGIINEQWIYGMMTQSTGSYLRIYYQPLFYIYFENGKLISW